MLRKCYCYSVHCSGNGSVCFRSFVCPLLPDVYVILVIFFRPFALAANWHRCRAFLDRLRRINCNWIQWRCSVRDIVPISNIIQQQLKYMYIKRIQWCNWNAAKSAHQMNSMLPPTAITAALRISTTSDFARTRKWQRFAVDPELPHKTILALLRYRLWPVDLRCKRWGRKRKGNNLRGKCLRSFCRLFAISIKMVISGFSLGFFALLFVECACRILVVRPHKTNCDKHSKKKKMGKNEYKCAHNGNQTTLAINCRQSQLNMHSQSIDFVRKMYDLYFHQWATTITHHAVGLL